MPGGGRSEVTLLQTLGTTLLSSTLKSGQLGLLQAGVGQQYVISEYIEQVYTYISIE